MLQPAAEKLWALFETEWTYQLEHSPTFASVLGDRRWNDRWDDRSLESIEADRQHNLDVLAELQNIDRAQLGPDDQLNYDLFRSDYRSWIAQYEFRWQLLAANQIGGLPEWVRQPPGVQTAYQLADAIRFETIHDYEDWIVRLESFGGYVDQVIMLLRRGIQEKRVNPEIIMQRVPPQVRKQIVDDPKQSGFFSPFTRFPANIATTEQRRLSAAAEAAIVRSVVPAMRRFHDFLTDDYLPAAPATVGAWGLPNGHEAYAAQVKAYTTPDTSPEAMFELGLAEVTRIRGEMEIVKSRTGYEGSLEDFFTFLRTDERFYCASGEELLMRYRALCKQIDGRLGRLFNTLPRQPYGVEPTPADMAPDVTTGFYYPAAADGSRPGTYLVNLYRPETRPIWEMVPLTLHEAVPGHHFQTSLAAELDDIPAFRRFGYYLAFGEGWALYCETLGDELGLYDDPYDKFGQLTFEMWRAVRLVVDTGMHAKRWIRQKAIDYFIENSPRQELEVVNEIDRYLAWPGQALAYKVGQLKIRELRTRAERELADDFDVRGFHDAVLLGGSVPLDILERRVTAWIASTLAG